MYTRTRYQDNQVSYDAPYDTTGWDDALFILVVLGISHFVGMGLLIYALLLHQAWAIFILIGLTGLLIASVIRWCKHEKNRIETRQGADEIMASSIWANTDWTANRQVPDL